MKVCEVCGDEIAGGDSDTTCTACEDQHVRTLARRQRQRRERHEALTSLGLVTHE